MSTTGALVVTSAVTGREAAGPAGGAPTEPGAQRVAISARLTGAAKALRFSAVPELAGEAPEARSGASAAAADPVVNGTTAYDMDRSCAVPRNDSNLQVYQPTPEQVEWAVGEAVHNELVGHQRPANWKNNGMSAYTPQGGSMFPPVPLIGGGSVPAQVLLGILAQESNMWQASWHIVDGSGGNPLTSMGFYGISSGDRLTARKIDWTKTDCGYGVGQVTTGMRKADTDTTVDGIHWTYDRQKAVALDYAVNVAASLRILQTKWNQTRSNGIIANNGDPRYIENWWFALWAYNTGFYSPQRFAAVGRRVGEQHRQHRLPDGPGHVPDRAELRAVRRSAPDRRERLRQRQAPEPLVLPGTGDRLRVHVAAPLRLRGQVLAADLQRGQRPGQA
nr:hypothetical protein GCM10020092_079280 [Actinoplanes digitatis]